MSSALLSPVGESFGGWDPSSIFGGGAPPSSGPNSYDNEEDAASNDSEHVNDEATSDDQLVKYSTDDHVDNPSVYAAGIHAPINSDTVESGVLVGRGMIDEDLSVPISLSSPLASLQYGVEPSSPEPRPFDSLDGSTWRADIDPMDSLENASIPADRDSINPVGSLHVQDKKSPTNFPGDLENSLQFEVGVDQSVPTSNTSDKMATNIQRIYRGHRGRKEANRRMLRAEREKVKIRQSTASRGENGTYQKDGNRDEASILTKTVSKSAIRSEENEADCENFAGEEVHGSVESSNQNHTLLPISDALSTEIETDQTRQSLDSLAPSSPKHKLEIPPRNEEGSLEAAESDLEDSLDHAMDGDGAVGGYNDNGSLVEHISVASVATMEDVESVDMDAETPSSKEAIVYKALRQPTANLYPDDSAPTDAAPTKGPKFTPTENRIDNASAVEFHLTDLKPTSITVDSLPISSAVPESDDRIKQLMDDNMSSSRLNSARTLDSPFPEEAYIDAGYLNDDIDNFELAALLSKVSPQSDAKSRPALASPVKLLGNGNDVGISTKIVATTGSTGGGGKIMMYKPNIFDDDISSVISTPRIDIPRHPGNADSSPANHNMHLATKGRPAVKTGGFSIASGTAAPIRSAGVAFSPKNPSVQTNSPILASPRPALFDDGINAGEFLNPAARQYPSHHHNQLQPRSQIGANPESGSYVAQAQGSTKERFKIDSNILRRNKACICIQRHARGFLARRRVESYRKRLGRFEQSYCTNCGLKQMGGKYCKKCGRKQDPPTPRIVYKERPDVTSKPPSMSFNPSDNEGRVLHHNRQAKVEVYQPKQTRVATLWDKRRVPQQEDSNDEDAVEYDSSRGNRREGVIEHVVIVPPKNGRRGNSDREASNLLDGGHGGASRQYDADQKSSRYAHSQPAAPAPPDRGERQRPQRPQVSERTRVNETMPQQQVPPLPANRDQLQRFQQPPQVQRAVNNLPRQKKNVNDDRLAEDIDALERNLERELEALQLLMDHHNHASTDVAVKRSGNAKRDHDATSMSSKHAGKRSGSNREGGNIARNSVQNIAQQPNIDPKGAQQKQPQIPILGAANANSAKGIAPPGLGNADVRLAFEPQPLSPDKDRRNKNSASVAKSPSKPAPPPLPIDMMKQQQPIQQQIQVPAPPPSSAPLLRPPDAASARVGGAPHAGAGRGDRRHRMQAPGNSRDPLDSARAESISLPDIAPPRNAGSHPHPLDSRRQQQQAAVRSRKQSTNSAPHALSSERRSGMEVLEDEGMLALPQLQTPAAHHQQQPRRPKK